MRLGSAMTVAMAGSYSSDSTLSLGTSICCTTALIKRKKGEKKKKKKKRKEKEREIHGRALEKSPKLPTESAEQKETTAISLGPQQIGDAKQRRERGVLWTIYNPEEDRDT